MDLRDMFTTWNETEAGAFRVRRPLEKTGCPCNRVPHAMWKIRMLILERMAAEGHELTFHPRYEMTQDGVGIRCRLCGLEVRGFIVQIGADFVNLDFVTPEIDKCEGPR